MSAIVLLLGIAFGVGFLAVQTSRLVDRVVRLDYIHAHDFDRAIIIFNTDAIKRR
jgi:hypothetical protein